MQDCSDHALEVAYMELFADRHDAASSVRFTLKSKKDP